MQRWKAFSVVVCLAVITAPVSSWGGKTMPKDVEAEYNEQSQMFDNAAPAEAKETNKTTEGTGNYYGGVEGSPSTSVPNIKGVEAETKEKRGFLTLLDEPTEYGGYGMLIGAAIGAGLGFFVLPGLGVWVGGFLGAIIGMFVGKAIDYLIQ